MKKILIWRSEVEKTMRGFVKRFSYGQKGFTLIELLVVVAILGVLAAVVMPNVSKFMGSGKTEAGKTELANVQLAMTAMMADTGASSANVTAKTSDMTGFPGGSPLFGGTHNYLQRTSTTNSYSVDADGVVRGWWASDVTKEIGIDSAP